MNPVFATLIIILIKYIFNFVIIKILPDDFII